MSDSNRPMTLEDEYRARVEAMSPRERISRAESLFAWSRGLLTRSLVAAHGPLSDEQLRWELALRHYGTERRTRCLINELRDRATG